MNKSVLNYMLGSLALFIVTVILVATLQDPKSESSEETVSSTTTTAIRTVPVSTFPENETTGKVPNPCDVISIENVLDVVPSPIVRGPIVQTGIAPSKLCDWSTENEDYPRLGVSIILSKTFFDESEANKVRDETVGEKAFVVEGFVTGFGGAACGETIIVKLREYSYSVAVCNENDKKPSSKELIQLAKDVENSLP